MKKKMIALTSGFAFIFNVFTPNIFAHETLTNTEVISKENNINTIDSQNKLKLENDEKNKSTDKTKDDKVDNSLNNKIKKNNTVDKEITTKVDNNINSNNSDINKEENSKNKIENNTVSNNFNEKPEYTKTNNSIESNTVSSNLKGEDKSTELNSTAESSTQSKFAEVPDPNLKAALNKKINPNRPSDSNITISELQSLKGNSGSLNLAKKNISNITGLEYCTSIIDLNLSENNISDLTPLENLTNIRGLELYGNKISDVSPLSKLDLTMSVTLDGQRITADEVESRGPNAIVDNFIKNLSGNYVDISNTNNYTYDSNTRKVTFNNISQTGLKFYSFKTKVQIGHLPANFAGTVTENVVYNKYIEIPDKNFRACLNRNIYKGDTSHDNDNITLSQLETLTAIDEYGVKGIQNISGIENCKNLINLHLQNEKISDISLLTGLIHLEYLYLNNNIIVDLSPLKRLNNLKNFYARQNQIVNINPLTGLHNLIKVDLSYNKINNISSLEALKNYTFNISLQNQNLDLKKVLVDDGNIEIDNPVIYPDFYQENPYVNILQTGNISYVKEGNKLNLSDLSDSDNEYSIQESASINNGKININYSANITLPVEHVSIIKVDLPTSMTFDIVTNTINPETHYLEPTFATANYSINNRGKKPVNITPSYLVTLQDGVDLVESIRTSDIATDNNLKIAIKLKELSTNNQIMSVVNKAVGTQFIVESKSNTKLTFEPGKNGIADVAKEQLSETKTTTGKIIFTISN